MSQQKLYCPVCRVEDKNNNTSNGRGMCVEHMMYLVPWEALKNYNRKWRRSIKPINPGFTAKNIRLEPSK